jgi:hypothetical protein
MVGAHGKRNCGTKQNESRSRKRMSSYSFKKFTPMISSLQQVPKYAATFYLHGEVLENPKFYDEEGKIIQDPTFFKDTMIQPHYKFPIYNKDGNGIGSRFLEARLQPRKEKDEFNLEQMRLFEHEEDETVVSLSNEVTTSIDPYAEDIRDALRKKYGKTVNSPFLEEGEISKINSTKDGVITLIGNEPALGELKHYLDTIYLPFLRKYYDLQNKKEGVILKNLNKMSTKNFTMSFFELIQRDLLVFAKKFPNLGLHLAEVYSNLELMEEISANIPRDFAIYNKKQEILAKNSTKLIRNIDAMINSVEGKRARTGFKLGAAPVGFGQGGSRRNKRRSQRKQRKTKRRQK